MQKQKANTASPGSPMKKVNETTTKQQSAKYIELHTWALKHSTQQRWENNKVEEYLTSEAAKWIVWELKMHTDIQRKAYNFTETFSVKALPYRQWGGAWNPTLKILQNIIVKKKEQYVKRKMRKRY